MIDSGMAYLYRIMPFYLLYTILSVLYAELRGYGDTLFPTMIMIGCLWLVRVPSAYGLLRFTGPENMFFCYGIGWVAEMLVLGFYYQHFRKRKREKLEQKQM